MEEAADTGLVVDTDTGLGCYEAQIITCYLEFGRCYEAVEAFKEAYSTRLDEIHSEFAGAISIEEFAIQISRILHSEGNHKHLYEVLGLQ